MNDFGLSEMEMNMSFTDLLNRPQMNKNFEEDIGLVSLNVEDETAVSHELPVNEIDYDENGSDVDDDEIIDARTKHKKNENSVQETHLHPQHPQRRQRATQARQVAYYSDFEGEQTLRGITAMQGADTFIQSQTSSVSNDIPSFVDSRGRKCISSSTLQSWARK
ncbi:uncharacterized protein LOC141627213 isoform X2 [Silene latifolia]